MTPLCHVHRNRGEHYCRECGEMTCSDPGCDCSCFRVECPNCGYTFSKGDSPDDREPPRAVTPYEPFPKLRWRRG